MEKNEYKMSFDEWLLPIVAEEHNNMNSEYFEKNTVGTYPYFNKLKNAIEKIINLENEKISCLDIGCGAGWQAKYLQSVGLDLNICYEGLDISPIMCELARKNYPSGNYYVSDILKFSTEKKWQMIMACGSIEVFIDWEVFMQKIIDLSSKWIVIHKVFFTTDNAPDFVEEHIMYNNLKTVRIFINYENFEKFLNERGFLIKERYDWPSTSGVICEKIL